MQSSRFLGIHHRGVKALALHDDDMLTLDLDVVAAVADDVVRIG